jgi:hypothetical protein
VERQIFVEIWTACEKETQFHSDRDVTNRQPSCPPDPKIAIPCQFSINSVLSKPNLQLPYRLDAKSSPAQISETFPCHALAVSELESLTLNQTLFSPGHPLNSHEFLSAKPMNAPFNHSMRFRPQISAIATKNFISRPSDAVFHALQPSYRP